MPFTPEIGVRFPVPAVWKKQKSFFSIHSWNIHPWPRGRVLGLRPPARVWISNYVSGGQCHLTHLAIIRRFSWPNLAYVHKCGLKTDSFIFLSRHRDSQMQMTENYLDLYNLFNLWPEKYLQILIPNNQFYSGYQWFYPLIKQMKTTTVALRGLWVRTYVIIGICVKVSVVGSLRDREVACSASHRQGSNFESCVWRTVSSQSSHHPQMVLLAQFTLYVHKGGLKPDSFHLTNIFQIIPANRTRSPSVVLRLDQRRRRSANVETKVKAIK